MALPEAGLVLAGKRAVVTGASRGIGRAVALDLAANGADVVLGCRSRVDLAEEVAAEIQESGRRALVVRSDLSTEEGARAIIEACIGDFGGIDALVNNAGVMHRVPIETLDESTLMETLSVDLVSCFHTCRYALADMVRRGAGGRIVNISSIISMIGMRGATAYAASKGGLNSFTACLAREVARDGITVNAVAPGYVETEMIADWPHEHFEKVLPRIPLRRFAQTREVADLVTFLIGRGGYITGQTIVIDGGVMVD